MVVVVAQSWNDYLTAVFTNSEAGPPWIKSGDKCIDLYSSNQRSLESTPTADQPSTSRMRLDLYAPWSSPWRLGSLLGSTPTIVTSLSDFVLVYQSPLIKIEIFFQCTPNPRQLRGLTLATAWCKSSGRSGGRPRTEPHVTRRESADIRTRVKRPKKRPAPPPLDSLLSLRTLLPLRPTFASRPFQSRCLRRHWTGLWRYKSGVFSLSSFFMFQGSFMIGP